MPPSTGIPSQAEIDELDRSIQRLTLTDDRILSYNLYGAEGGKAVFHFHGGPSSRLEGSLFHQFALERNYRVICPDRPGHGYSDPKPGYKILDLADDVRELADHLALENFGVMGLSGGGPPVIACAYRLADRLDFAVSFGGAAPIYTDPVASRELSALDRIMARLAATLPRGIFVPIMGLMIGTLGKIKNKDQYLRVLGSLLCDADRQIVDSKPDFIPAMMYSIREAFRQGASGPADDTIAIITDWGFPLTEIEFPVVIVHGTEDNHVPFSFSEYLHAQIPNSRLISLPGDGHYVHIVDPGQSFDIIEGRYTE